MREIKFRTWDTQNKEFSEWTNRDPFFSTSHGQIFFWERTTEEDGSYGGDIILEDTGNRFILQQYTGMKDKNGREIYEGDILEWGMSHSDVPFPILRFVEFHDIQLIWKVVEVGDLPSNVDYLYEAKEPSTRWCKIVGNIFTNPELLSK